MSNNITVTEGGNRIEVRAQGTQGPEGPEGGVRNIVEVSTTYTTSATDAAVIGTGTFTITLHALSTATQQIVIKNVSGTITVDGSGSETIDGSLTQVITLGQSLTLIPTSTGWEIV